MYFYSSESELASLSCVSLYAWNRTQSDPLSHFCMTNRLGFSAHELKILAPWPFAWSCPPLPAGLLLLASTLPLTVEDENQSSPPTTTAHVPLKQPLVVTSEDHRSVVTSELSPLSACRSVLSVKSGGQQNSRIVVDSTLVTTY